MTTSTANSSQTIVSKGECRGNCIPSLFDANDVALLSASAQGLQQLLHSLQSCAANDPTVSIPILEVVIFGRGHHDCTWKVAGLHLERSQSFTHLGMLFHADRKIKHAFQARFSRACASVGSILSQCSNLQSANSVQLLVWLQQASCSLVPCKGPQLMQPVLLRKLQSLQHSFLRHACRLKSSVAIEIMHQELSVTCWHDFWWRRVLSFWNAMAQADSAMISNIVQHDAIVLAQIGIGLARLHRSSDALLSMASPGH